MKLGLGLSGENHSAKTNVTTEPIAAPPALCILSQNLNPIAYNFPGTRTTFSTSKVEFKSGFLLIYGHEKKYFSRQKERAGGAAAGSALKFSLSGWFSRFRKRPSFETARRVWALAQSRAQCVPAQPPRSQLVLPVFHQPLQEKTDLLFCL
ncbi:hypothetical protein Lpp71_16329 [Lacticaseibacillus paracasei subsp. paracasei Lpp71]|uniref:Uncharacterized protein n=1 Tax=Lacticaseibacillus paracasei subsp. paracasei Lpp71 TaxID=1256207 RepID=A0A8E0MDA3_LACPA|nr:hypothetical protein Lpp71_16329 [Lacticaseibacillus paracasei subsp. paracasei Lpp71]